MRCRLGSLAAVAGLALLGTAAPAAPAADRFDVSISRTSYGIPHIKAKDFRSMGYGYGYVLASDVPCTVAEAYVTVNGERSKFFGPDKGYAIRGNGSNANNLNSDFFFKAIIASGKIDELLAQPEPLGPRNDLKEGVKGYVAGWNARLRDIGGADGITDPSCKGEPWVREITEADAYRRFYQLALLASSGVAIDGIAGAQPPTPANANGTKGQVRAEDLRPGIVDERLGGLGSNAVALGKDGSKSGHGLLYGNPHFPWYGSERFYQSHLTIPGKVDVMGGSLLGVPIINIGFTKGMAWSHTVSTARRFAIYEHKLVPGDPTSYVVDGRTKKMTSRTVKVEVKGGGERTRTLWSTERGPVLTSILGLPIFPWTPATAYALDDANDENFGRLFNHFMGVNEAQTVDEVDRVLKKFQGIPWVNTIAADTAGNAYYADIGSIQNITDEKLASCSVALGVATDQLQRLPVLDGARSACAPDTDADAVAPGILGLKKLPSLRRDDYTSNMNDSYWLTNPRQPIEGYDRIIGDERTARSLRTRVGLDMLERRLKEQKFDLDALQSLSMSNRVYGGELLRDELASFCRTGVAPAAACDALANWDLKDDLDSKGAVLFRRFMTRLTGAAPVALPFPASPFSVPFDPNDPVNTPRGLNVANPLVTTALTQAVRDMEGAGLPFDADLRRGQTVTRAGETIPVHGGPGGSGVYNVITPVWDSRKGYTDVVHGSSYVQAVELTPGCPKARTILTYSQSTDPTSPHFTDQTKLYRDKGWVEPPFCASAIEKDPSLTRTYRAERGGATLTAAAFTEARGTKRPRLTVRLAKAARVVVTVTRNGRRVRKLARRLPAGEKALLPKLGKKGSYRVRVQAGRRDAVRFAVRQRPDASR